jgi:hypothetical protein
MKKYNLSIFFSIFVFVVIPSYSWAACSWVGNTGTPGSFTSAEVSTCISEAASKTGEVIIQLPTGTSSSWNTVSVNMSAWTTPAKLTIQGDGKTNTIISVGTGVQIFNITGKLNIPFRITGIKFSGSGVYSGYQAIAIGGTCNNWRIDNNHFYRLFAANDIWIKTYGAWGLIDNNIFEDSSQEGVTPQFSSGMATSWADPLTHGGVGAVYIESNTFIYTTGISGNGGAKHAVTGYQGSRYVFRYNTLTYNDKSNFDTIVDAHGACSETIPNDGTRWIEVYNNTLSGTSVGWAVNWRGGDGIVFNNTFSGINAGVYLNGDVTRNNCNGPSCYPGGACDYLAPGQIRMGYIWGNSWNGAPNTAPVVNSQNYIPHFQQANRDYNLPTSGTYANMPATCTHTDGYIHRGYWATDQNTLYTCTATNTWTAYYTPYTYPHPLTQVDPSPLPPQRVRISN